MIPSRRKVFQILGAWLLLPLPTQLAYGRSTNCSDRSALVSDLIDQLKVWPSSAYQVGSDYINNNPKEASFDTLFRLVLTGPDIQETRSVLLQRPKLNDFIAAKIRGDFNTGNISVVDGWFLSRTESRIFSLYYLSKN